MLVEKQSTFNLDHIQFEASEKLSPKSRHFAKERPRFRHKRATLEFSDLAKTDTLEISEQSTLKEGTLR